MRTRFLSSYRSKRSLLVCALSLALVGLAAAQAIKRPKTPAPPPQRAVLIKKEQAGRKVAPNFAPATANFVYHEQTANFVATPTCSPSGGTNTSCGRYVENTDRSAAAGFQIYSPETYTLHYKVEFQFFTNQVRVYYTTDGSNPSGSFGTPFGTTQVAVASFTCTYDDQTQSCQIVDVVTGSIPPQAAGTTVKYIVSAWHSGGGPEVFANSGTCGGCPSCTDSTTGCATVFQYNVLAAPATPLIISEFRLRGPGPGGSPTAAQQAGDEYVEIYNNSNSDVMVNAFDGSAGFALAASDGTTRFTIPNGTTIPARGHYLGVNSVGYSLAGYPAASGTTATGDATYTTDIPDNFGIALFNTANPANFTITNRLDAVGSSVESNALYKEGTGYPALIPFNINYAFYRDLNSAAGTPQDTDDNASDFLFVDTSALCAFAAGCTGTTADGLRGGRHLGAPGPENSTSPIQRNAFVKTTLIDPGCTGTATVPTQACPRYRSLVPDPSGNGAQGTLSIRRRFVNNTASNVTRLRFRIVDITTNPPAAGNADLRALTSSSQSATCISAGLGCPSPGAVITIKGTTLEQPPAQPAGGGYNSSLSDDTITLMTPLAPGNATIVQFVLGINGSGNYRFFINVEALP